MATVQLLGSDIDLRTAFFAGAQHVFGLICSAMEESEEPTDADKRRIELIYTELDRFTDQLARQLKRPKRRA